MSEIFAKTNNVRIAPRKARLVADLVRNLPVKAALAQLLISPKRASVPVFKLLQSAIANAKHNFKKDPNTLYVKEIRVDKGMTIKRWWPRARGSVGKIEKKSSHITIVLDSKEKINQPAFVFTKKIRDAKTKKSQKLKEKTSDKKQEEKTADTKNAKSVDGKKKMFRRKSI